MRWTKVFMRRVAGVDLSSITHSYEQFFRVRYGCAACGRSRAYGNQSKMIEERGCRWCGGVLKLLGKTHPDGTLVSPHESEAFIIYVRKRYAALKVNEPSYTNEQLMAELRRCFLEEDTGAARARIDWAANLAAEIDGSEAGSGNGVAGMSEAEALFAPLGALRL